MLGHRQRYNDLKKWKHFPVHGEGSDRTDQWIKFPLIYPVDRPLWPEYFAERSLADGLLSDILELGIGKQTWIITDQIREITELICESSGLDDHEWSALADGVTVLLCHMNWNHMQPETACVMTRLYSITQPVSVDVKLRYELSHDHSEGAHAEAEWDYLITYRINRKPMTPEMMTEDAISRLYTSALGFVKIAEGENTDDPSAVQDSLGRSKIAYRSFHLRHQQVKEIRSALLGDDELPAKVRLLDIVRLLYASVGIEVPVGRLEGGTMDDDDAAELSDLHWALGGARWLAREIRQACGLRLARDSLPTVMTDEADFDADLGRMVDKDTFRRTRDGDPGDEEDGEDEDMEDDEDDEDTKEEEVTIKIEDTEG